MGEYTVQIGPYRLVAAGGEQRLAHHGRVNLGVFGIARRLEGHPERGRATGSQHFDQRDDRRKFRFGLEQSRLLRGNARGDGGISH
ncbi:hypothetical protein D3C83_36530 [compost metagenome]